MAKQLPTDKIRHNKKAAPKKTAKPVPAKDPNAPPKPTKEQLRTIAAKERTVKALVKSLGVVSSACKFAKISRSQYYDWIRDDPKFKEAVDEIADVALDFVESQLFTQIKGGNYVSTIFYLKTKGKIRGYIERTEVDARVTTGSTIIDWTGKHEHNNSDTKTT